MRKINLILVSLLIVAGGYGQELKKFSDGGKYGFRDMAGNVVIPAKFDGAGNFSEGLAWVKLKYAFGYIDAIGKMVIPLKYDYAGNFSEGLAWIKLKDKCGYIDKKGKIIIPLKYQKAGKFSEGKALVQLENQLGNIDKTGKFSLLNYDYVTWTENDNPHIFVRLNGKHGEIDETGKEFIPLKYDNKEMQIIWESPLISYLKQINDCRKTYENYNGSGSFQIDAPYLIIYTNNSGTSSNIINNMSLYKYSKNDFNEQSVGGLKTLIVIYSYLDNTHTYSNPGTVTSRQINSYGTKIIFFDINRKECVGYDIMKGPSVPDRVTVYNDRRDDLTFLDKFNSMDEIIAKIESHLAN